MPKLRRSLPSAKPGADSRWHSRPGQLHRLRKMHRRMPYPRLGNGWQGVDDGRADEGCGERTRCDGGKRRRRDGMRRRAYDAY